MKYTVFNIDDSRAHYTNQIFRTLSGWDKVDTECVNGRDRVQLENNIKRHGYEINWKANGPMRIGHLGIWYTVLNSFEHAPHITFEDDAMLGANFNIAWNLRYRNMPEDTDFFSLFLPRDSDHMFDNSMKVSSMITKTYQRYGGVSMYYTQAGAEKIKELLRRDGITGQYDDTLYAYSKAGELNGYCSVPSLPDLVYISGHEESIVQESETYEI